jgi:radical SAM protein with 4Fe4S-binding SPASM domain
METIGYNTFSRSLHDKAGARRMPLSVTIEVTRRCPLVCVHCYNNLPMADSDARNREMTYDEHCRLLDQLAESGCLFVLYTGGEIFARRDFLDIYTYAKRKGFLITLFTNGTLITERVADYLAEWRPFAIEITLYGHTKETYERLTGIPGSYDKCVRGIDLLIARGLPLKLKTVAVTINKHEIWDMQKFAEDRGLEFKFDSMMNPRIDCSQSPIAVRLSPEECVALDLADPRRLDEWKEFSDVYHGPVHTPATSDQVYHCGGGVDSFAVSPYGEMSICVLSQNDLYDLKGGSVSEGWEDFLRKVRLRKMTRLTKCVACNLKAMCGMCPANGELEHNDPESPVDFLCQVAHMRAHLLGLPVPPHGDCEYCPGGAGHGKLMASVAALPQLARDTSPPAGLGKLLPMAASGAGASGGCATGGCGSRCSTEC